MITEGYYTLINRFWVNQLTKLSDWPWEMIMQKLWCWKTTKKLYRSGKYFDNINSLTHGRQVLVKGKTWRKKKKKKKKKIYCWVNQHLMVCEWRDFLAINLKIHSCSESICGAGGISVHHSRRMKYISGTNWKVLWLPTSMRKSELNPNAQEFLDSTRALLVINGQMSQEEIVEETPNSTHWIWSPTHRPKKSLLHHLQS